MGVSASVMTSGRPIVNQSTIQAIPCPNCGNQDPVEDFRQGERFLWICPFCSRSFAFIPPEAVIWRVLNDFSEIGLHVERIVFGGARQAAHTEYTSQPRDPSVPVVLADNISNAIRVDFRGTILPPRAPDPRRPVQRLGGQPNRSVSDTQPWQPAAPPARIPARSRNRVTDEDLDRLQNVLRTLPEDPPTPEDGPPVTVVEGTRWVQRKSGLVVEVVRLEHSQDEDRTQIVVYRPADADSSTQRMVLTDFTRFHRMYSDVLDQTTIHSIPPVQLTIGEEWASLEGDLVVILGVDLRKESVLVEVPETKQRRTISLTQFAGARWRKVVRKSAYDRILDDDAFEEA